MFSKTSLVVAALGLFLATTVNAAKVSSFKVCTDAWSAVDGGSANIYVCKGNNNPDLTREVGTYSYFSGPLAINNGNDLYLLTESFEINGCILQRIGTFDTVENQYTESAIWTTNGAKGCPKASNIGGIEYESVAAAGTDTRDMFTFTLKKAALRTPLTTSK